MGDFPFKDGVAVVTGAASGIGGALAEALAARGSHLALADRDAEGLEARAEKLRSNRIKVTTHLLDVTDREACEAFPEAVRAAHGPASMIFNNAGVAVAGRFGMVPAELFDKVMEVNLNAPIRLTRAFLPQLREAAEGGREGRIVNISSLFGIVAPPGQTAYSASKFGLRGFSEALRHELAEEGVPIGVTVVHPGGVKTNVSRNSMIPDVPEKAELMRRRDQFEKKLKMPPPKAAEIILGAVERRSGRVLVGGDAKLLTAISHWFPETYWRRISRIIGTTDEGA